MKNLQPQVGVVTIVVKDQKILFGKRLKPIGYGQWALPGGHLEMYESFEVCAWRETFEESKIEIKDIQLLTVRNNTYPDHNKHYITVIMIARHSSGTPIVPESEREKCGEWQWFDLDNVPEPLFETHVLFSDISFLLRVWSYIQKTDFNIPPSTEGDSVTKAAEEFRKMRQERLIP